MPHVQEAKTDIEQNALYQIEFEKLRKNEELLRIRVAADLNDEDNKQICEVPAIPAARHDENGDIAN